MRPATGWESVGTLQDAALRRSAEAGITEIAAIIPDKPGALIVNNARATVWGRELPGAGGLPLGAAFAALTLGFLADGEQQLYRAGRWFRLSGPAGTSWPVPARASRTLSGGPNRRGPPPPAGLTNLAHERRTGAGSPGRATPRLRMR